MVNGRKYRAHRARRTYMYILCICSVLMMLMMMMVMLWTMMIKCMGDLVDKESFCLFMVFTVHLPHKPRETHRISKNKVNLSYRRRCVVNASPIMILQHRNAHEIAAAAAAAANAAVPADDVDADDNDAGDATDLFFAARLSADDMLCDMGNRNYYSAEQIAMLDCKTYRLETSSLRTATNALDSMVTEKRLRSDVWMTIDMGGIRVGMMMMLRLSHSVPPLC